MKNEAVDALNCQDGLIYVDCTLGGGGHSELILKKISFLKNKGFIFPFKDSNEKFALSVIKFPPLYVYII